MNDRGQIPHRHVNVLAQPGALAGGQRRNAR